MAALCEDKSDIDLLGDSNGTRQILTACVESISLMEWSYCSARMASFLVCSSFSLFSTALWSDLGVDSSRWFLRALYCLVWVLQVSWNCFLIWSSLDWEQYWLLSNMCVCVWFVIGSVAKCFLYLEALGLLSDLHDMLPPQLPLPPLVVLQLVCELGLVLGTDQLGPRLLDRPQMPELQLLHRLVMPEQHGVLQVLLRLPFVQLLEKTGENSGWRWDRSRWWPVVVSACWSTSRARSCSTLCLAMRTLRLNRRHSSSRYCLCLLSKLASSSAW